ncbi:MAG: hypothetical protein SGPRY_011686 [Prymnesium sp.]
MHMRVPRSTAERSGLLALDAFQRTYAIPALFTLIGFFDIHTPSPTALWRVTLATCAMCGLALAVEFYSPLPRGMESLYRVALPMDTTGDAPLPPAAFFEKHCWLMIVLPLYRLIHATLRSLHAACVLPVLGVLIHFCAFGANLVWPLIRHPYDTMAAWPTVSTAYFGSESLREWLNLSLPRWGLTIACPGVVVSVNTFRLEVVQPLPSG